MTMKPFYPMLVVIAILGILGCQFFEDESVPPDLIGRWVTEAPGYEACFTDITDSTISFYTVRETLDTYFIDRVRRVQRNDTLVLDIHYENREGDDFVLSVLLLKGGENGQMQFHNQRHLIWNKVDPL